LFSPSANSFLEPRAPRELENRSNADQDDVFSLNLPPPSPPSRPARCDLGSTSIGPLRSRIRRYYLLPITSRAIRRMRLARHCLRRRLGQIGVRYSPSMDPARPSRAPVVPPPFVKLYFFCIYFFFVCFFRWTAATPIPKASQPLFHFRIAPSIDSLRRCREELALGATFNVSGFLVSHSSRQPAYPPSNIRFPSDNPPTTEAPILLGFRPMSSTCGWLRTLFPSLSSY